VSDTAGNAATVRKSFSVSAAAATAGPGGAAGGPMPSPEGTSASVNVPPLIKPDMKFSAQPGGGFTLSGIVDPDGDDVAVRWTLMEDATGRAVRGTGPRVRVPAAAPPGAYQLLLTADDGRGGVSEAAARVEVRDEDDGSGEDEGRGHGGGGAGLVMAPQTLAPSIYVGRLAAEPRLPSLTFFQGATLDLDAAASGLFDLSRPAWKEDVAAATCVWNLRGLSPGAEAGGATVYGCGAPARFRLHTPGRYALTLDVERGDGSATSAAGAITVNAKPGWGAKASGGGGLGGAPGAFVAGRCMGGRYFGGFEFAPVALSCGGLVRPGGGPDGNSLGGNGFGGRQGKRSGGGGEDAGGGASALQFSWKLTPLTSRAARAHERPLTRASASGAPAAFGAVAPGIYVVEVVGSTGGAGGAATGSVHSVYYLATLAIVEPTNRLRLPPPMACAGRPVKLAPAPVALLPGQAASLPRWRVTWLGGGNSTSTSTSSEGLDLTGSGGSFTFVAQPGRYAAVVTVDVSEPGAAPRRLTGRSALEARPCLRCASGPVTLFTAPGRCAPAAEDAAKLVAEPRPAWLEGARVEFATRAILTPGTRAVAVIARAPATGAVSLCTAPAVTIKDATPPAARLRRPSGECAAPANGRWACWAPSALASASDACSAPRMLQSRVSCRAAKAHGGGRSAGGSGGAACRALPDGRVCIRADPPPDGAASAETSVEILFRDAAGNALPAPLRVPVTVLRDADPTCALPALESPQ
jgi:hypothetical protein